MTWSEWWKAVDDFLENFFVNAYTKPPEQLPMNMPATNQEKLYQAAKSCLGQHITLDPSVPPDLGCAEAVSFVLQKAGAPMPAPGFAGTSQLYQWLRNTPVFEFVTSPNPGDIILSPSGSPGSTLEHGHVGVVARYGILSNNSYTGKFDEALTFPIWKDFYQVRGHMPVFFIRWLG